MDGTFKTQSFDISMQDSKTVISRNYVFNNNDTISISISLKTDANKSLADLHQESIRAAITHLQALIPPN